MKTLTKNIKLKKPAIFIKQGLELPVEVILLIRMSKKRCSN